MAVDIPDITLPINHKNIRHGVEEIVERVHPRPRGADCLPVAELEERLIAFSAELVRLSYKDCNTAAGPLRELVDWLVSMDEPGNKDRRTVTLNQIIERARAARGKGES